MPAHDLTLLIDAAQEAGRIASRFTGTTAQRWDKPGGAGPVTEADLAVNAMLEAELQAARPDYGWLSEETEDSQDRLERDRVFIIDPIDGTRSFTEGSRTWAHSLAIAEKGIVTAAVIFLPQRDLLYTAEVGKGAHLNGKPLTAADRGRLPGAEVLANRGSLDKRFWRDGAPEVNRSHRPSLAYRMALVAQGRYDAMLTMFPAWEWDIAAGDLILREAGATVSDTAGQPLVFNQPHPRAKGVVAAGKSVHVAIMDQLAPA
ncbi:3'(2'),5'-bisphosphate nucleotidase CysQ [Aestuariivita boseongensis]|uniref:3'(2'),5'-bisphosphate nucleotidase CysQ n=1 Tax=Aestuariivita boseongensis TaxID=1470562 RepID=UPI00067FEF19|nr:3'(2'),5'-bisphosphate nucleotidase CysQ [Aestuariivita boseongensis]